MVCALGYQSSAGSTACGPCPTDYGCPVSSDPSQNFPCSPGFISDNGVGICSPCPAGSACINSSTVILCSSGTFSLSGSIACESCPAGIACPYADGHGNIPCSQVVPLVFICTKIFII